MTYRETQQIVNDAKLIDENLLIGVVAMGDEFAVNIRDLQTTRMDVAYRQLLSVKNEMCAA